MVACSKPAEKDVMCRICYFDSVKVEVKVLAFVVIDRCLCNGRARFSKFSKSLLSSSPRLSKFLQRFFRLYIICGSIQYLTTIM